MPEGPEAHVISDMLSSSLMGRTIKSVEIDPRYTAYYDDLNPKVAGKKIIEVSSRGKKVLFTLADGEVLRTSMGMTGRWLFREAKHTNLVLTLEDGEQLYFDQSRPFGDVRLFSDMEEAIEGVGVDIINDGISDEAWETALERMKNRQLVSFLQEQRYFAGIGNYLKSEILYCAKLFPSRKVSSLTAGDKEALRKCIVDIARESYHYNGLTIENYLAPDGSRGCYPVKVYGRKEDDERNAIKVDKFADGRSTYYVPKIQR